MVLAAGPTAAALLGLPALADKGYHGAGVGIHTPAKGAHLAPSTTTRNRLLTRLRANTVEALVITDAEGRLLFWGTPVRASS